MKIFLPTCLLATLFLFPACESDQEQQTEFAGTYQVTLESPEAEMELRKAKEDMQADLDKAREDIRRDMKDARKDIESELGEDSRIGQAVGDFVEGVGEIAANMTQLGESLGNLGIGIGSGVLRDLRFTAKFEANGKVSLGKGRGISITSNDLRWKIKDGDMYLWDEDEGEANADRFEIKKIGENKWDLLGEEVTFHLVREP